MLWKFIRFSFDEFHSFANKRQVESKSPERKLYGLLMKTSLGDMFFLLYPEFDNENIKFNIVQVRTSKFNQMVDVHHKYIWDVIDIGSFSTNIVFFIFLSNNYVAFEFSN